MFWWLGGWLSLGLGIVGIFLPLLPTTPFVLLAAWCFARSSERWHRWLLSHRIFGPVIRDWLEHRAMRTENKRRALVLIILTFTLSILVVELWALKLGLLVLGAGLVTWMWRIPVLR